MTVQPRYVVACILLLLILVFVVQNTEVVAIRFLAWEFQASLVILITLIALAGFVCGYLVGRVGRRRTAEPPVRA